jgi:integrase
MARKTEILNDIEIRKLKKPGYYPDGGGLYIQVTASGGKSWLYRYKVDGKSRWKGLGGYGTHNVTLVLARKKAGDCRRLRAEGIDPISHANEESIRIKLAALKGKTFKQCAEEHIDSHKESWSNDKHVQQWTNTLTTYVYPVVGDLPVEEIDTALIERILSPIWRTKNETATRIRQRIEAVLARAIALKYRDGPNPALWRGGLDALFPAPKEIHIVTHQPSMEAVELPEYYQSLVTKNSISALALRFLIQTCVRSTEGRGAHIDEFDFDKNVWTIPAERMKGRKVKIREKWKSKNKPHEVPITAEMLSIVKEAEPMRRGGYIFPGKKANPIISDTSVRKVLQAAHPGLTIHGFRATFRTWSGDKTNYAREVCEACLAHSIESQLEKAYQRGTFFDKRRELMSLWSNYSLNGSATGKVIPIKNLAK